MKGSRRVSVIEVKCVSPKLGQRKILHPGDSVHNHASLATVPVKQECLEQKEFGKHWRDAEFCSL